MAWALIGVALVFALAAVAAWLHFRVRHRYVGVGWALEYNSASGYVIVGTRLLDSPAGRAGIPIGARVRTFRGYPMTFTNGEAFVAFMQSLPEPRVEEVVSGSYEKEGRVHYVEMRAEIIQGPIPDNRPPPPVPLDEKSEVKEGLEICLRTGEIKCTRTFSEYAINKVTHGKD